MKFIVLFFTQLISLSAFSLIGGSEFRIRSHVFINNNLCSGVMISENKILTAGHCIIRDSLKGPSVKKGDLISVLAFEGSDWNRGKLQFQVKVDYAVAHPSWIAALSKYQDPNNAADDPHTFDIGIIIIDRLIPISTSHLATVTDNFQNGVLLSGSGCEVAGANPTFNSKTAWVNASSFDATKILIDTMDRRTNSPAALCKGDSGGGVFLADENGNQTNVVVGINSTQHGMPGKINQGIAADLRDANVAKWINALDIPPVPSEVAINLLPQNIDEEFGKFVGAGSIPGLFQILMTAALREPTLKCYNHLDDFGEHDSPELLVFLKAIIDIKNKGRQPSQIRDDLLSSGKILTCVK